MAKKKKDKVDEEEKTISYETFVAGIDQEYGSGAISTADNLEDPAANKSGSLTLDIDLRIPCPAGRFIEIVGEEHSGKTTLALEILGQAQLNGRVTCYNNVERNLNRSLVDSIRTVDPSKLHLLKGDDGEANLELVRQFIAVNPGCVVVVDSIDALTPEAILNGAIGDAAVGKMGKLMSDACRKLNFMCEKSDSTIIWINQFREKIMSFGDPRTTPGGRAVKYYASQRFSLKGVSKDFYIKDKNGRVIGHWARYNIMKNKVSPPYIEGQFPIIYGKGIYRELEVAKLLKDLGLVESGGKGGGMIRIGEEGEEKLYGVDRAAALLESSPKLYEKYHNLIMENF